MAPPSRMLTSGGRTRSIRAWAHELGIKASAIHGRLARGKTPEQALSNRDERFLELSKGQRFGEFELIEPRGKSAWLCVCGRCNQKRVVVVKRLKRLRSCCGTRKTHGASKTSLYKTWTGIKSRCFRPTDEAFKNYGGRGITLCPEWRKDFQAFERYVAQHLGPKPNPTHSIEREDNAGDYAPGNIKWGTPNEQANNRRNNRLIEVDGVTKTIAQWSASSGVGYHTLYKRLENGASPRQAIEKGRRKLTSTYELEERLRRIMECAVLERSMYPDDAFARLIVELAAGARR